MKTLELSQMENLEGGFDWEECARGATTGSLLVIGSGLIATPFGFAAWAAGAAIGCVVGGNQ